MSALSRIPAVVQRILANDAACESVYYFATVGAAASPIPVKTIVDEVAASASAAACSDSEWKLLYDVMKVDRQRVLFEEAHLDRIRESYQTVTGSVLPREAVAHVQQGLHQYIRENSTLESPAQNVKFVSWLRAGAPASTESFAFVLCFVHSFFPPAEWYRTGTNMALLYHARRENPNAKVVQSELRARAAQMQKLAGVFEVLLVHDASDGYLIPEGSRSNYLLVMDDGTLLCSAEEDILIGITLRAARRAAVRAGLGEVQHRKLTLLDLCAARSCIMLGTSPGTLPVREVLVYMDAETMHDFDTAATSCGVNVAALREAGRLQSSPGEPQRASLRFTVNCPIVERLMEAFKAEAFA